MSRFVISIVVTGIIWTLSLGKFVENQVSDVVVRSNLATLSRSVTAYSVFNNKFPENLDELVREEGLKNVGNQYKYLRGADGQSAAVLGVNDRKSYCWNSEEEKIMKVESVYKCQP
jgi:hypothetical protein